MSQSKSMLFLYGSQNFGYDTPTSDKDWLRFVFPTLKNIIYNDMISKEIKNDDGSVTKVKDIRLILKMIEKANFNDLQVFYSQEAYNYDELGWFIDNRDLLVRYDLHQMFKSNVGYIYSSIKKGTKKDNIRALCFLNLIRRALDVDTEFVMINKDLANWRGNDSLIVSESYIEQEIKLLHDKLEQVYKGKDTEIMELAEMEIEKLLKNNLNTKLIR